MTVDGAVHDQPAELARMTGLHARYGAVHSFPLIEPEDDRPSRVHRGPGGSSATPLARGSAMWGNAILTREPIEGGYTLGLPRAADDDLVEPADAAHELAGVRYADAEPGHREPRCVVGGTVGGVAVATTHLTYIGREQRRRQAEAMLAVVSRQDGPAIVTGDLNAPIDTSELAVLRDGFDDAFVAVGIPEGDDRRRSCGPWSIDHILVRGFEVISCRVAREAGDLSDHWPIVADLRRS